jgi:hypothetical protein
MALLPTTPFQSGTKSLNSRYPENLGQKPFDKWMCFEARAGRHVLRDRIVPERSTGTDRTLAAVGLYISPSALKDNLSITYDTQALGPFLGSAVELLAQGGSNLFDTRFNTLQDAKDATITLLKAAKQSAGEGTSLKDSFIEAIKTDLVKLGSSLVGEGAAGAILGQKVNPKTDVLFDTQEYRCHSYDFLLAPRSINEAKNIDRIINFFQFYSLPSFRRTAGQQAARVGSFMIGFPYEFVITFKDDAGRELEHINRVARSVLKSVAIDHAAGGKTAFIKEGDQFYPVATRLTLEFQEVILLGRDSDEIKRPVPQLEDPRA